MARKIKADMSASVRARLLAKAKEQGRDFNAVLLQYGQERFLYRLSMSRWRDRFLLKGALLFLAFEMPRSRPTKDIDLLGMSVTIDLGKIREILREIVSLHFNDGILFDPDSVEVERIKENQQYEGARAFIKGELDSARIKIQIDIGVGDVVAYIPPIKEFPCLIDLPKPKIAVYSLESSIAEKLEAISKLGLATSRMKDFYDILYLARNTSFSLNRLRTAVRKTFAKRNTDLALLQGVYHDQWKVDTAKQIQWQSFVARNKLDVELKMSEVIDLLRTFVSKIYLNEAYADLHWDPSEWSWK